MTLCSGNRIATLLIYESDVEQGGAKWIQWMAPNLIRLRSTR